MTYCKDCRTEFMVEADDPCPRCGRYLGGARMGQRAEVALPEQSAQPAAQKTLMDAVREHFGFAQPEPPVAQQAPVPPPAAPAPTVEPPRPAQQGQTPLDAAEDEDVPPSRMRRAMLALRALLAWLVAEASPNAPPLLMTRGMLLVLLTIPAGIGFLLVFFYQYQGRHPAAPLLWFLYLSVFVPPFVCLLTPDDALSALLRGHPWFWKLWLLWAVLAVGLSLWAMIDPNTFRIFLSVFGGGYY
ncbi:MAG: hypothetical protein IJS87_09395 [Rhodocyclaceae bacterium]|nr:hypothetical protein [Rhodocyclaceae bacterium]